MMRSVALALILVLASAPIAQAGAWLREKGKGFLAASVQSSGNDDTSGTLYFELGLTDWMTTGADITYDADLLNYLYDQSTLILKDDGTAPEGSAIFFLRFPIGPVDQTNKWAFHLGAGTRYVNGEFLRAKEIGVSWGRGIKLGERYGWVNIDSSYNKPENPAKKRVKLDGTLGLGLTERTKGMLQMFNTIEDGNNYSKIAPSVLFAFNDGRATLQVGGEIPISGSGETTLKLGVWFNF